MNAIHDSPIHYPPSPFQTKHLFLFRQSLSQPMIPQLEKPRVTEIHVRMDCNGCVQKIKKALQGINGIYDLYIDFAQQKITIIGWADPEKIVKAIKKTRKIATIFTHTEPMETPAQPTDSAPESGPPTTDAANPPPPAEAAPPAEVAQQAEPPKDPPPPENPSPDVTPSSAANDNPANQAGQPSGPKDVEEVHVVYHHPPDYGHRFGYVHNYSHGYGHSYGGHWNTYPNGPGFRPDWNNYPNGPGFRQEPSSGFQHKQPPPDYVTHSYNTYKPSPYVTEYEYIQSPPRHTNYSRLEHYSDDHRNNGNGNISSMFSDENPNACRIV